MWGIYIVPNKGTGLNPVQFQIALSQEHPKAVGRWWDLIKQVPFVSYISLHRLNLFTLLDCSSGNTTNQVIFKLSFILSA